MNTTKKSIVDSWLRHRLVTNEIIEMISDDDLLFKPWDKALSLKDLVLHIGNAGDYFVRAVIEGSAVRPSGQQPEVQTALQLQQFLAEVTSNTRNNLESLTAKQLENPVDLTQLLGTKLPGRHVLQIMREHEIHHKGQLFTYARMIGLKNLPKFIKKQL
ncbi:DinB family protein [Neobacillus sp. LXY-4]|uniref:DinB family protein n=1 Tax=Neobacillus sp. LXY-4 TaxID=3379826 RepID=UPI003EDF667F